MKVLKVVVGIKPCCSPSTLCRVISSRRKKINIKILAMIPISVEDTGTDRIPEIRTFGGGADWEMVVDAMTDINLALHVGECIAHLSDKKFMVEIF